MEELDELLENAKPDQTATVPDAQDSLSVLIDDARPETGGQALSANQVFAGQGVGESRYDKGYHSDLYSDLEDFRAKSQPGYVKAAAIVPRVAAKVSTELLKLPGYLGGAAMALGNEAFGDGEGSMDLFVNNQWVQAIEGLEETINEDVLPVYVKKSVRDGNLLDNLTSIDFWATEGADGLAFMLAMFAPGAAVSKLGAGTKILSGLGKTTKGRGFLNKIDEAAELMEAGS